MGESDLESVSEEVVEDEASAQDPPPWHEPYTREDEPRTKVLRRINTNNMVAISAELPTIAATNTRSIFPKFRHFAEDIIQRQITACFVSEIWQKENNGKFQKEVERMFELNGLPWTPRNILFQGVFTRVRIILDGGGFTLDYSIHQESLLSVIHYTLYTRHYMIYSIHCTLYIVHFTLYITDFALYTLHYTLYTIHTIHYTLHTIHITLYTLYFTVCARCYTLYAIRYSLYAIRYMLFALRHTLYAIHYTLNYTLYTIHYTLYTIHYTLYTIHYTLYTIHYTLYTIYYTQYSILYTL